MRFKSFYINTWYLKQAHRPQRLTSKLRMTNGQVCALSPRDACPGWGVDRAAGWHRGGFRVHEASGLKQDCLGGAAEEGALGFAFFLIGLLGLSSLSTCRSL